MPATKHPADITDADRPFVCSRGNPDGTVTLYYQGEDVPPMPVTAAAPSRYITPAEYRNRFSQAELLALLASTDPVVRLMVLKVSTAPEEGIDLLSPTVADGLAYLVAKGLLQANRPAQIVG